MWLKIINLQLILAKKVTSCCGEGYLRLQKNLPFIAEKVTFPYRIEEKVTFMSVIYVYRVHIA